MSSDLHGRWWQTIEIHGYLSQWELERREGDSRTQLPRRGSEISQLPPPTEIYQCNECGWTFSAEAWPTECAACEHYHCGDDQCCYGKGFAWLTGGVPLVRTKTKGGYLYDDAAWFLGPKWP